MSYTVHDVEYDENNAINQEIKDKFVESHVKCCMTSEVEFMLSAAIEGFRNDDNVFTAEDWETAHKYDGTDENVPEVFEWWIVDNWLGRMLSKHNEIVLESCGKSYWGRCCSGQAIELDGVISDIALELEILQGQKYEWND